jgi:hypothetical protein
MTKKLMIIEWMGSPTRRMDCPYQLRCLENKRIKCPGLIDENCSISTSEQRMRERVDGNRKRYFKIAYVKVT